jgi:ethanolamine transporter EutH
MDLNILHFMVWKLYDTCKDFIIFYLFILLGEWFVQKRGFHLFERALIITIITMGLLTTILWSNFGRLLIFF